MREEAIPPRGTRRLRTSGKAFAQRPVRRESGVVRRPPRHSLRALFSYLPSALKFVLGLAALVAAGLGYHAAASASLFQVRSVDVSGTSRTSAEEIGTLARRAASRAGVWRADLPAISAELARLPGVRRAIVTRVLPDGLRVRILERVPFAVVRTSAGHLVWIDDEGVALGEVKAIDRMPAFFIRGWSEDDSEEARQDNLERVLKYQELVREWDAAGLSARVSEVSLVDIRDLRAQLAGDDSQIEVRLGGQDPGKRLKDALEVLDEKKQTPSGALITYIDITQGKRAVVGFSSGVKLTRDRDGSESGSSRNNAAPGAAQSTAGASATSETRRSDARKSVRDQNSDKAGKRPRRTR